MSKWNKYDDDIKELLSSENNCRLGYSDLAKKILGPGWDYRDVDLLRTYIRRTFSKMKEKPSNDLKILIYDLETSLLESRTFWTGKTYVSHANIKSEPKILTVAWKYLYEDKVYHLKWDQETRSDKKLVEEFVKIYNEADCVIGINNNSFDNKWLNTRAAKYNLPINTKVKSFDIQKQVKRFLRLPSYSMKYMAQYFGLPLKGSHAGIEMWENICFGSGKAAADSMEEMIDYNVQDIVVTEALYYRLKKYLNPPFHIGVLNGGHKWQSPYTGSTNVSHRKITTTMAGTLQHSMYCHESEAYYKISNTDYLRYLERDDQ